MKLQGRIKVAIIDFAVPSYIDCVPAHQTLDRAWVESVCEDIHILCILSCLKERIGESLNRHVGDREERIERDVVVFQEAIPVVSFQLGLGRRKRSACWIIHQI